METVVYAARLKDHELLKKSSSGGAFRSLSDVFLERGDAVVCAVYDYDSHSAGFKMILTKEERDEAIGSKYMQSIPGTIYKDSLKWLKDNPEKKMLFVGMGCQAAGFRKFIDMSGLSERVTVCDIICHGSPSPKIWRDYAGIIEKKHGKIEYLTFKDKRRGWNKPLSLVVAGGKEVSIQSYKLLFTSNCIMRPACHRCPYARIERSTDITIGDYWHIEKKLPDFYDSMGNSLVLIHSEKGKSLFDAAKSKMEIMESNKEDCWQKNLEKPTPCSSQRTDFWKDYEKNGISSVVKNYGSRTLMQKIKHKIKKFLR